MRKYERVRCFFSVDRYGVPPVKTSDQTVGTRTFVRLSKGGMEMFHFSAQKSGQGFFGQNAVFLVSKGRF
jgi:hypothetical protein